MQSSASEKLDVSTDVTSAELAVSSQHTDSDASAHLRTEMSVETEHDLNKNTALQTVEPAVESTAALSCQTLPLESREAVRSDSTFRFHDKPTNTVSQHEAVPTDAVLQRELQPSDAMDVLTAEALSRHKAVPTDADFQQKAEPELQHKSVDTDSDVQNDVIPSGSVLPTDTVLQHDEGAAATNDVLEEKAVCTDDELRLEAIPSDASLQLKAEPDCTVLQDEAVPDDTVIKHATAAAADDDDNGLVQTEVRSCESKEGLNCVEERHISTGIVTSYTEMSDKDKMSAVECNAVSLQETDSVNSNISETKTELELATRDNSQTTADDSLSDAVQSAELPVVRHETGRNVSSVVDSDAVNTADDSENSSVHGVEDISDVGNQSSCKQLIEDDSAAAGKVMCTWHAASDMMERPFFSIT